MAANANNGVKFVNSVNSLPDGIGATVGKRISSVLGDLRQALDLRGGETIQVSSGGGAFETRDESYTLRAGDEVRFSRSAGTKG